MSNTESFANNTQTGTPNEGGNIEELVNALIKIHSVAEPSLFPQDEVEAMKSVSDILEEFVIESRHHGLDSDEFGRDAIRANIRIPLEQFVERKRKPWLNKKVVTGFFGHFNSGKSSLLNALLGTRLPQAVNPSSALPTYITAPFLPAGVQYYGVSKDEKNVHSIKEEQFLLFDHTVAKNFPLYLYFNYLIVVCYGNQLLRNISFLDTPGILHQDTDNKLSSDAFALCDEIFWCIPATSGATVDAEELAFFKSCLEEQQKPLYIVLTKADLVLPWDREANLEAVKKQLEQNDLPFTKILFFTNMKEDSEFNTYLEELNVVLKSFQQNVSDNPISKTIKFMRKVESRLESLKQTALSNKRDAERQEEEADADLRTESQELSSSCSSLVTSCNNLHVSINDVIEKFNDLFLGFGQDALSDSINSMTRRYGTLADSINKVQNAWNDLDINHAYRGDSAFQKKQRLEGEINVLQTRLELGRKLISILEDLEQSLTQSQNSNPMLFRQGSSIK